MKARSARHFMQLLFLAALVCGGQAPAQEPGAASSWPQRPITILIGFPPGGNLDGVARLLAPSLSEHLGQPVVIENKPGASGSIAASQMVRSAPDGHTLYLLSLGHASAATLQPKLPYDSVGDFKVAGMLVANPFVLATRPDSPFKSVADVIRAGKQSPDRIDYGTAGIGTGMHLVAELFSSKTGARLNHIPYKGGSNVQVALLGGEIPLIFTTPAVAAGMHASGKMRILGVSTRERFPGLPDVPTISESGVPGFDVRDFMMLAAPKGTPDAIVNRINAAITASLAKPQVRAQLEKMGAYPAAPTSPAMAQAFLAGEVERWRQVIRDANIATGAP